jgi:hypothetical protein
VFFPSSADEAIPSDSQIFMRRRLLRRSKKEGAPFSSDEAMTPAWPVWLAAFISIAAGFAGRRPVEAAFSPSFFRRRRK